jgi:serine/threonine protein kinase
VVKVINKAQCAFAGKGGHGLRPRDRWRQLIDEVHISATVAHPLLPRVVAVCETASEVRIVMERVVGGNLLNRLIDRGEPLCPGEALLVTRQLLEVLTYLHTIGVAHRDVKVRP